MADKLDLLGLQTVLAQADDQIHQAFWPIDETQTAAIFQQPGCCCADLVQRASRLCPNGIRVIAGREIGWITDDPIEVSGRGQDTNLP